MNKKLSKILKIIGIVLLSIILVSFFLLFTTPEKRLTKYKKTSQVIIKGNLSDLKNDRETTLMGSASISGGTDLCHPDSPPGECYPPTNSIWDGPKESLDLKLSGEQITEIVNEFKPSSILISDVIIEFQGDTATVEAVSYYPFAPGLVRAEVKADRFGYSLEKLYFGRFPASEEIRKAIEQSLDSFIINSISVYGVAYSSLEIRDGYLYTHAFIPSGMVQFDQNGNLIIDVDVIDKYKAPVNDEVRIM